MDYLFQVTLSAFWQSKNHHKLFLKVFQKKGTILRKQNKKGLVL